MTAQANLDSVFQRILTLAERRALSDIALSTSEDTPALTVHDHTFVRLLDKEVLVLHCPTERKILLMEISPDIYSTLR